MGNRIVSRHRVFRTVACSLAPPQLLERDWQVLASCSQESEHSTRWKLPPKNQSRPLVETARLWPLTERLRKRWEEKSAAFRATVCTFSKACPMGPPLLAQGASCRQRVLSRGAEFATRCSMVASVLTRIPLTSLLMERTSRIQMKMHSYSIGVPLPQSPVRIASA